MFCAKAESGLSCRGRRLGWFPAAVHFKGKKQGLWRVFAIRTSNGSPFMNGKEHQEPGGSRMAGCFPTWPSLKK